MKTLTKALICVGLFIFAFVVVMIITFWKFQQIPDVLVTCVLGTGTAELIATAIIEIVKRKNSKEDEE